MLPITPIWPQRALRVLAFSAHPDDVEIGAGGLVHLLAQRPEGLELTVVILSGAGERGAETEACLAALTAGADLEIELHDLPDTELPRHTDRIKGIMRSGDTAPDLVLAPYPGDAHQDHRIVGELTTQVFRDHLILHYEIPKWDGDFTQMPASVHIPLSDERLALKWDALNTHHQSQRDRDWWDEETFRSLARLRGIEARTRYAEAFAVPRAVWDLGVVLGPHRDPRGD